MKVLYRYSTKDGNYVWPQGKTEALRACRQAAKLTPNDITLEVQEVTLKDFTNKTMLRAALNGEDVVAIGEDGEYQVKVIAEVKGKLKPSRPEPPKLEPLSALTSNSDEPKARARKYSPYLERDDVDEEEYVTIWAKGGGYRLLKLSALRPGTKVLTSKHRVVTW